MPQRLVSVVVTVAEKIERIRFALVGERDIQLDAGDVADACHLGQLNRFFLGVNVVVVGDGEEMIFRRAASLNTSSIDSAPSETALFSF